MAEEKKLQVKNLQVSFRTQAGILKAVRNVSFDLHTGESLLTYIPVRLLPSLVNLVLVNQSPLKRLLVS